VIEEFINLRIQLADTDRDIIEGRDQYLFIVLLGETRVARMIEYVLDMMLTADERGDATLRSSAGRAIAFAAVKSKLLDALRGLDGSGFPQITYEP
jgi:hypothetical protein